MAKASAQNVSKEFALRCLQQKMDEIKAEYWAHDLIKYGVLGGLRTAYLLLEKAEWPSEAAK